MTVKKIKVNKSIETGSQGKPEYQARRTYEHLLLIGPNAWAVFGSNDIMYYKIVYMHDGLLWSLQGRNNRLLQMLPLQNRA
jgi:hypothetical protein